MSKNEINIAEYFDAASGFVRDFLNHNDNQIKEVIGHVCDSLKCGGLLHGFGTGHSALNVLEMFHRAGGLIPVNPIVYDCLSPVVPPSYASKMERTAGIAEKILKPFSFEKNEVILIFSNSGINSVPIEVCRLCTEMGLKTVAITSVSHSNSTECRHPEGLRLLDVADIVLDTRIPKGDAVISLSDGNVRTSPVSTMIGTVLVHTLALSVAREFENAGLTLPVYISANTEGAVEKNEAAEVSVKNRILLLNKKPELNT